MDEFKSQPNLRPYFANAYGYAYFPTIGKGGFGIGGATGSGLVYVNVNGDEVPKQVGEVTMVQVSFGWQLGGQVYSEVIFFESQKDFQNFTSGNFEFSADANVVALTASASARASTVGNQGLQAGLSSDKIVVDAPATPTYTKGMAIFTIMKGGLMYEASISGQKFNYKPLAVTT